MLYTTTNIDVLLLSDLILEHICRSLDSIGFVFLTRSKKSTNRRFIKSHSFTNLDVRPTFFLQTLSGKDLVLLLLSKSNRLLSSKLSYRKPHSFGNFRFRHTLLSKMLYCLQKMSVTSAFRTRITGTPRISTGMSRGSIVL